MSWTVLTPLIIVGSAIAIIAAERRWPYDHQRFLRPGLGFDLIGYALAQSWILALVIGGFVDWIDSISGGAARGAAGSLTASPGGGCSDDKRKRTMNWAEVIAEKTLRDLPYKI